MVNHFFKKRELFFGQKGRLLLREGFNKFWNFTPLIKKADGIFRKNSFGGL